MSDDVVGVLLTSQTVKVFILSEAIARRYDVSRCAMLTLQLLDLVTPHSESGTFKKASASMFLLAIKPVSVV